MDEEMEGCIMTSLHTYRTALPFESLLPLTVQCASLRNSSCEAEGETVVARLCGLIDYRELSSCEEFVFEGRDLSGRNQNEGSGTK